MVNRKLIVSERDNIAALMEDNRAVEFFINRGDMLLGDVYLVTVENILPSIDAAFVNMGADKMGFLHASDIQGKGDLKTRLKPKQQLVVQIIKEPTGHKGPRVTTDISLPGRFLVLIPDSKGISISRKIESAKERARLKSIVSLLKPAGVGVIIRTEANDQTDSDIQEDLETLLERWQNIVSMADTANPPALLYRDQDLLYRVVREVVTEDLQEMVLDTPFGQQRAQQLLQNWNMDKHTKATLYSGNQPFLVGTGVDREIKLALQTRVPLPSGGYLYIQPTEALCVIDVNSGKFTSLDSQAETIRLTNLEASKEIARQLRLRNIGGMIIVDFIDMESRADQLALLEAFENELAPDKSKPQMGQLTDLGLVEMTRHRQGQALSEMFTKRCIACNGTGHAIEELNWSPMLDKDAKQQPQRFHRSASGGNFGGRGGRNNQYNQRGNRGNQGKPNNRQQQQQQQPPDKLPSLKKVLESKQSLLERDEQKEAAPTGRFLQGQGGQPPKSQLEGPMDDYFRDKIMSDFGVQGSTLVKMSHTPPESNSVLSRINPRSNDVQTLVNTIEDTGAPSQRDDDDLDTDNDNGNDLDTSDDTAASNGRGEYTPNQSSGSDDDNSDTGTQSGRGRRGSRRSAPDEGNTDSSNDAEKDADTAAESSDSAVAVATAEAAPEGQADTKPDATAEDKPEDKPKRRRGRPPKKARPTKEEAGESS